jgi:hypothetical protein
MSRPRQSLFDRVECNVALFEFPFEGFPQLWQSLCVCAEAQNEYLRNAVRALIIPLLGVLLLSEGELLQAWNPEAAVFIAGLFSSASLGLIYH